MPSNNYHFSEKWNFPCYDPEQVFTVLANQGFSKVSKKERELPRYWHRKDVEQKPDSSDPIY